MSDDIPPKPESQSKSFIDHISQFLSADIKNQQDLLIVLKEAEENRLIDSESFSMMESILQFAKMQVRDVMIPRVQMNTISKDAQLVDIFPLIIKKGHSRYPVIIEGDRSEVVGILLTKDLIKYIADDQTITVESVMRPHTVTPESKRLNVILNEFRTERHHMAIVVDEYGMTAGLITIEDVLEQIVGKIEDEHDSESQQESYIEKHNDTRYTLQALTPIDDFNQYFSSELQDDEHETIGGFITRKLGFMPKKGDRLDYQKFRFEILHADDRRIYLIKLKLPEKQS